jgi:hypothetical protein
MGGCEKMRNFSAVGGLLKKDDQLCSMYMQNILKRQQQSILFEPGGKRQHLEILSAS